jgi:hypothetical protein
MSELQDAVSESGDEAAFDSKLIPVMREAILTVQMVLYRVLKENLAGRFADWSPEEQGRLAGAVVNNLFGTEAVDPEIAVFARNHRDLVSDELGGVSEHCKELIPFLTDALRMQAICDNQEGIHSLGSLLMAKELGILREDRALPLPSTFMLSVRNLAGVHGIIEPQKAAPPPEESPE